MKPEPGAPFEGALLFRRSTIPQRDELLPEIGSASIELAPIADVDASEVDMAGWARPSQGGPDQLMLKTAQDAHYFGPLRRSRIHENDDA